MDLSEYLKANSLTPSTFAARIGVAPSTITRVIARRRKPGLDLLHKIHAATDGAVEPKDFFVSEEVGAPSPFTAEPAQ